MEQHIAFTFPTLPSLLTSYTQRKTLYNMHPTWCVNHGPTMSIYYRDPDGNQIETQVDVFETAEEANAFIGGEEFAENPMGVDFVPEEVEKRLERGEDVKVIMKRERIGKRGMDTVPGH
jgi:hypothetical protein